MRSSSPIVFAAALLLCCAAPAGTQPATDPDLEKGIDLAQRGYFEESIGVLKRVATRLKTAGGDPDQRARTYLYLAVAHHGLGQGETATSLYVEAINTDRSLEISVDEFPPRIVQFFEDARREALASGQIRIAEPAPTPGPAPTPEPAAEAPSAADVRLSPLAAGSPLIFKKVDLLRTFGDEVKKFDARLTLDPLRREIVISDEKHKGDAWATYARIPYHAVIELAYEKSAHRRKIVFSKGKKHWLTISFEGVETLPANFVYLQLDKNNYHKILTALEGATGIEPSITIEK